LAIILIGNGTIEQNLVNPSSIQYSKYSIINYCFFKPETTGLISNTDSWADENLLQGQINWSTTPTSYYPNTSIIDKAHQAGTKVMVSIGGWTLSDNFPAIAANATKRATFANECNRLLTFYNFDGIDIDWEYPGFAEHSGTPSDKQNFTILLQQIKDSITALTARNGKQYLLSACFSADPAKAQDIEWTNVVPILDMLNLMSYDFFGTWDCAANHNSPLFAPANGNPQFNLNSAFLMLTNTYNVPSTKINVGMAFYGRSQQGASTLYQNTNCLANTTLFYEDDGSPLYYNIQKNIQLFDYHWDSNAQVSYLLGKSSSTAAGTFVSYDDKVSIGKKAQYAIDNNARGAIIWEITGDYLETSPSSGIVASTPLIDTINTIFCNTVTSIEPTQKQEEQLLVYPNPSNGQFNLIIPTSTAASTCNVYTIDGKLIQEINTTGKTSDEIKLSEKGVYFIRYVSKQKTITKKLIVQ
jgi:GH18 family chitinase